LIDGVNDVPDDDDNGNFPIVQIDDLDWELVKYTVEGGLGNCHAGDPSKGIAYFAVRRRCVSKRLDHITEVLFLCLFSSLSHCHFNRFLFFIGTILSQTTLRLFSNHFTQRDLIRILNLLQGLLSRELH
jgi:hypothetical protein